MVVPYLPRPADNPVSVIVPIAELVRRKGDGLRVILKRHRWLVWELAKREHTDRYSGAMLGWLWAVGHPLVMMVVYVVIFTFVFKLKIGGTHDMPLDYTTYLMAGYLPWMAFQESMNKASSVISSNASLVKQVVFPLEVLPIKGALASVVTQLIGTVFLIGYTGIVQRTVPMTYGLIPVVVVVQLLAMVGASMLLAALGAYVRDLKEVVQVGSVVGVYLLPIFYLPTWVPEVLQPLLYLNPFSYMIWCYQDVFYYGRIQHPFSWFVFVVGALVALKVGMAVFQRARLSFGNVL